MQAITVENRGRRQGFRAGFTLLELMIVIVIIGILVGLLLPAVTGVWGNVRNAQVKGEISQLDAGIASFKNKFGMEPPSRIVLWEKPNLNNGWATSSPSADARAARAYLRQMFPQFDFTAIGPFDLNGDGSYSDNPIELTSGECLVFFLGGIWQEGPSGFSKNPAYPFLKDGNREGPFFEFNPTRFVDSGVADGFREYVDAFPGQTLPYQYFSSYDGSGYAASEFGGGGLTYPYYQSSTITPNPATPTPKPWKPQNYQIISPGRDRLLGIGGNYDPNAASNQLGAARADERDNITNFSDGPLAP